ncbi:hypothetical protein SEMRO_1738_G294570.1 [Seminavis robusta]|uniref:DDE Tnp4 domain-containing protein n=1 Tax=Seminavis robusta TaxID=568900 RepID=A0A9N8HSL4_9STRA|nr:hypothetical protein SEMRO_1738_G294570.1 [Seminavis robusta]|eukprot:Sro1738_g294570.1 n/a (285) ;mRNA; r:22569-23566
MRLTEHTFRALAQPMIVGPASEFDRDFVTYFGCSPHIVAKAWNCNNFIGAKPKHLLWALVWMNVYGSERVHCKIVGVKWENRFRGDKGRTCLVTVDTTDVAIPEPPLKPGQERPRNDAGKQLPFNPKWYSKKVGGAALRYETAVCIQTGDIVSINGPFPAGRWNDPKIFHHDLLGKLGPEEMVEADGVYKGMPFDVRTPHDHINEADKKAKSHARARHEIIHHRIDTLRRTHQNLKAMDVGVGTWHRRQCTHRDRCSTTTSNCEFLSRWPRHYVGAVAVGAVAG